MEKMKATITGSYTDNFNCEIIHVASGYELQTDAPKDNNGKGACFSPTDLVAASLGTCIITTIAIKAKAKNIEIGKPQFQIFKHMKSNPRQIDKISVEIVFDVPLTKEEKDFVNYEAKNCPVALSLNPELIQDLKFTYKK